MSIKKQQHEGFAKFFEAPTRSALRAVIKDSIGETDYLDFKTDWPEYTKLAKHILALSNSGGGALIVGVSENDDGTHEPTGLKELRDKEKVSKGIKKYLPESLSYEVLDFTYEDSEYARLKGKKFQVILVEYTPKHIPFLSKKAGTNIQDNAVYVRRGTNSDEATHEELQKVINERIETGYSSAHLLELPDHIEQLKALYESKAANFDSLQAQFRALAGDTSMMKFKKFLAELIVRKKARIEEELDL